MPRIVHFEQMYDDPKKAAEFYRDVFDWKVESWEGGDQPYWLVTTGPGDEPGINGGFLTKPPGAPQSVMNTIGVDNINEYIKKAEAAGAKPMMPKTAIAGMGWTTYYQDPAGVMFGLFQSDESAK